MAGKFRRGPGGEILFSFGPHRGSPIMEHEDYLHWMASRNFPPSTREVVNRVLDELQEARDELEQTRFEHPEPEPLTAPLADFVSDGGDDIPF